MFAQTKCLLCGAPWQCVATDPERRRGGVADLRKAQPGSYTGNPHAL